MSVFAYYVSGSFLFYHLSLLSFPLAFIQAFSAIQDALDSIRIAALKKLFSLGSQTVKFLRFRIGLGSTAVSNFGSVPVKVQIN